jgi:deoxyribodipyrimidine photo-lyase
MSLVTLLSPITWRSRYPIRILDSTIRHFPFIQISFHPSLRGLVEVSESCEKLNLKFHLLRGQHIEEIPKFVKSNKASALVCDFSPLRIHNGWVDGIKKALPGDVPLVQVDAHNIVQIWIASDKQECAARTIRNKINSKPYEFLTEFPPLIEHPHKAKCENRLESCSGISQGRPNNGQSGLVPA